MPKSELKPNGKPFGTFLVSIDDGFVEYQYELKLRGGKHTIHEVWEKLRKAYRVKQSYGHIRTKSYVSRLRSTPNRR